MKFEEMLPALREGKRARRQEWEDAYIYYKLDHLFLNIGDGLDTPAIDSMEVHHIMADDWEILDAPTKPDYSTKCDYLIQRKH